MARAVICLGVLTVGLAVAAPATAQHRNGGYVAVSKLQIDPRMQMLDDGTGPQQQAQPHSGAPATGSAADGIPLDQLGDQDADAPLGDDPVSDNAVETDTVYTA